MQGPYICSNCGNVGWGKTSVRGNGAFEIILWLFFIIPGLIYSLWRSGSRFKICSVCGQSTLIPLSSPNAKQILEKQGKTLTQAEAEVAKNKPMGIGIKIVIGVIAFVVIMFVIGWFM